MTCVSGYTALFRRSLNKQVLVLCDFFTISRTRIPVSLSNPPPPSLETPACLVGYGAGPLISIRIWNIRLFPQRGGGEDQAAQPVERVGGVHHDHPERIPREPVGVAGVQGLSRCSIYRAYYAHTFPLCPMNKRTFVLQGYGEYLRTTSGQ